MLELLGYEYTPNFFKKLWVGMCGKHPKIGPRVLWMTPDRNNITTCGIRLFVVLTLNDLDKDYMGIISSPHNKTTYLNR